jgi:hypothetical protein
VEKWKESVAERKRTYEGERRVEMLGALEIPLAGNFGSGEDASAWAKLLAEISWLTKPGYGGLSWRLCSFESGKHLYRKIFFCFM